MSEPSEKDWLEEVLRAGEPALPDEGFALRTLQALPAPRRRARARRWILLLSIVVACGLALLPAGSALAESFRDLFSLRAWSTLSIPWLALACIATVIWLSVTSVTDDA